MTRQGFTFKQSLKATYNKLESFGPTAHSQPYEQIALAMTTLEATDWPAGFLEYSKFPEN
jgi:hypothetical protein